MKSLPGLLLLAALSSPVSRLAAQDVTVHGKLFFDNTNAYLVGVSGVDYLEVRGASDATIMRWNRNTYDTFIPSGRLNIGTTTTYANLHVSSPNTGSGSTNWIAADFGGQSGDRVVTGLLYGVATIGAHNSAYNAWANLSINLDGGNVAIGTTDPQGYKLAVGGSMIATSIKVKTLANWPDYVFARHYHRLSLPELEQYLLLNKHLPEVPTADEVKENGINLAETDALLLKKIEELTLYLIEQNKQINELKQELQRLKK